ncbi:MAG: enoyl-CoA hydratase [Aestuariibacter sp.]
MDKLVVNTQQDKLIITINRPEKRNALTSEIYQAMADALNSVDSDSPIKVVLLQAEGEHFTAGNDLSQFASISDKSQLQSTINFMYALMDCPVPVVAKVQGLAVGIGTTLLMHCDFVYASDTAKFSLPFVNLGLVPEYASSLILPKLVGHAKAAEWLMLGEPFGAEEALNAGLANKVCGSEELSVDVDILLNKLSGKPRLSLTATKGLMKKDLESIKLAMENELVLFFRHLQSVAAKEAFAAFLEKRKPDPEKYK